MPMIFGELGSFTFSDPSKGEDQFIFVAVLSVTMVFFLSFFVYLLTLKKGVLLEDMVI